MILTDGRVHHRRSGEPPSRVLRLPHTPPIPLFPVKHHLSATLSLSTYWIQGPEPELAMMSVVLSVGGTPPPPPLVTVVRRG
ncbi:hypothetical protein HanLR1_Chr11g0393711 [Helianthus annuus]|nr:hypothetical protein HanHA89_Chr11g0416301 [Helianthus annuus]KAJ0684663.1 hypothetical protein HanLR1_Chr11g0393711 [Helianthus annuus]